MLFPSLAQKQQAIRDYLESRPQHSTFSLLKIKEKHIVLKEENAKQIEIASNEKHSKRLQRLQKDEEKLSKLENQLTLALLAEEKREEYLRAERLRGRAKYYKNKVARLAVVKQYQQSDRYKKWRHNFNISEEHRTYQREYMRQYRANERNLAKKQGGSLV